MNSLWCDLAIVARFWKYTKRTTECWLWVGPYKRAAHAYYGQLPISREGVRRRIRAHALGWEIGNQSDWPAGKIARHTCDNPGCVNPAHIIPGTKAENTRDMLQRGRHINQRKTHCRHGHPYSGDNVRFEGTRRYCRECVRQKSRRHYHNRKAAEGVAS